MTEGNLKWQLQRILHSVSFRANALSHLYFHSMAHQQRHWSVGQEVSGHTTEKALS